MMNAIDYQKQMAIKMIAKFKKEFEEKTDLKIKISVNKYKIYDNSDVYNSNEPIKYMGLDDLERDFMECIPEKLKNKNILRTQSRKREYVDFRSIYAHIACKYGFTFSSIGEQMERHHSTIISLKQKANNLLETDPIFFNIYTEILNKIEQKYV
jgi:hypothetical protein